MGRERSQSTTPPSSARASDRPRCAEHAFAADGPLARRAAVEADTRIARSGGQIYAGRPASARRRGCAADPALSLVALPWGMGRHGRTANANELPATAPRTTTTAQLTSA